jgi:hypothetical protein
MMNINRRSLTDEEVVASQDDLEMMRRPHLWSYGDHHILAVLPLIHHTERAPEDHMHRVALLIYSGKRAAFMFLPDINMFKLTGEQINNVPEAHTGGQLLLDAVFAEGWRVD